VHVVVIGGSDGGISAALRARELAPEVDVTVVLADDYPNFSICGLPYYLSGDVPDFHRLAHRSRADLEAVGLSLLTRTQATHIDVDGHTVEVSGPQAVDRLRYDRLVVATGARPSRPPIEGLERLGPPEGVFQLHTMDDAHAVMAVLDEASPTSAVVVGAGYIGLELAEALTARGVTVTQVEALETALPTLDPGLGRIVAAEVAAHGVRLHCRTRIERVERRDDGRLEVTGRGPEGAFSAEGDLLLVVTGVVPETRLAAAAGLRTDRRGALVVDRAMATGAPDVYAAGDCVVTHHALLGVTYLPLGTTAHKQGRVAGENAVGGDARFAGSLGTQVVKVFDLVAARSGLRDEEAGSFAPVTVDLVADDHKAYYPGAKPVHARLTGDRASGRLLGVQLVGAISTAVHKRIDTAATAIFAGLRVADLVDLDLSYTPPLGSPYDVLQVAAERWLAAEAARRTPAGAVRAEGVEPSPRRTGT
jgi:NADPH-dependent 2,4-dienoyl-CoA reductase/sulfur reductase-like enzyme